MNIHLLKDSEVDKDLYHNVLEILERYNGPLKFISTEKDFHFPTDEITETGFNKKKFDKQDKNALLAENSIKVSCVSWIPDYPSTIRSVKWKTLFSKCHEFRLKFSIPADDCVMLLTNLSNVKNWFAAFEKNGALNFFVHADQWKYYIPSDPRFPIAYVVMTTLLNRMMFADYDELKKDMHMIPRGCMNDFCERKEQITFKLRTADICSDCIEIIRKRNIDPLITGQILKTIEDIRIQMLFRERFKITQQPSRLTIRGPISRIFFTDLGESELKLTPLERLVYLLFLDHPEGLLLNELIDHKSWMEKTYSKIGNGTTAEMINSIGQLVNPVENSSSEKISRIKRKIEQLIGDELSENYIIEGDRGEKKKIRLNRALVIYEPEWRDNKY